MVSRVVRETVAAGDLPAALERLFELYPEEVSKFGGCVDDSDSGGGHVLEYSTSNAAAVKSNSNSMGVESGGGGGSGGEEGQPFSALGRGTSRVLGGAVQVDPRLIPS